jgi:predicted RNA binding protein YcfA (HicA-like mRNA interferase family)
MEPPPTEEPPEEKQKPIEFPSLKAEKLLGVLRRQPLAYREVRVNGSHRTMESPNGYPPVGFWFHKRDTIPPRLVEEILVKDVGLTKEEARGLI